MASHQITLPSQKQIVTETKSIFPPSLQTFSESKLFVKCMSAVAFSCITYLRKVFPEGAYDENMLDGRPVKVLSGNRNCKNAYLFSRYFKSAIDEVDNEYMRKLVLEILSVQDEPIEFYTIKYGYQPSATCSLTLSGNHEEATSEVDIRQSATDIIEMLIRATENWDPLPKSYKLRLRMYYYEDRTPSDYMPQFFFDATPDSLSSLPSLKRSYLGEFKTGFHTVKLEVVKAMQERVSEIAFYNDKDSTSHKICLNDSEESKSPEADWRNKPGTSKEEPGWNCYPKWPKLKFSALLEETVHFQKTELSSIEEERTVDTSSVDIQETPTKKPKTLKQSPKIEEEEDLIPGSPQVQPRSLMIMTKKEEPQDMSFAVDLSYQNNSSALELKQFFSQQIIRNECKVKCICNLDSKDEHVFVCSHCNTLQHYLCYKLWPGSAEPVKACCYACAKVDPELKCTDEDLIKYSGIHLDSLAKYRRLLYNMQWEEKITKDILTKRFNIPEHLSDRMIVMLLTEEYIRMMTKGVYMVKKAQLKNGLNFYFRR